MGGNTLWSSELNHIVNWSMTFFKITSEGLQTIVARVCMEYFKLQIKAKHCFKKVVFCGCCSIYFSSFVAVFLSRMLSFFSLHTELEVVLSVNWPVRGTSSETFSLAVKQQLISSSFAEMSYLNMMEKEKNMSPSDIRGQMHQGEC